MSNQTIVLALTLAACGGKTPSSQPTAKPIVEIAGESAQLEIASAHVGTVGQLVWSHDGKRVASSATFDSVVRVWDAATGAPLRTISETGFTVKRIGWSDDDRSVIVVGYKPPYKAVARFVVLDTGKHTDVVLGQDDRAIAAIPGDRILVSNGSDLALITRNATRRTLEPQQVDELSLTIASDGSVVASASKQTLVFWTVADGKLHTVELDHHIDKIYALAGGRIAVRMQKQLRILDATGRTVETRAVDALAFAISANGTVTAATDLDVLTITTGRGGRTVPLAALGGITSTMQFTRNADRLAIASGSGTISIVDVATAQVVQRFGHAPAVARIVDFIDEEHALVATNRGLVTFDLATGKVTGDLPIGGPAALGTVRGQGFVLAGHAQLQIRQGQFEDKKCDHVLAGWFGSESHLTVWGHRGFALPTLASDAVGVRAARLRPKHSGEPPRATTWTPKSFRTCLPATPLQFYGRGADPRDIATGTLIVTEPVGGGKPVRLGTTVVGEDVVRWLEPHLSSWTRTALSAHGRRIAAVGYKGVSAYEAFVWNGADGKVLQHLSPMPSGPLVALSPDGNNFALATVGEAAVFDVDKPPNPAAIAKLPPTLLASALAVADSGVAVVGGSLGDVAVVRGTAVTTSNAGAQVDEIALSPSGARALLLVGGAVQIWRLDQPKLVATMHLFADGEWITIAPDGLYDSSFEASRRISWRFDAPLANVDLERYSRRYHAPDRLTARLRGVADALLPLPPRPPALTWASPPRRDGGYAVVEIKATGAVHQLSLFADGSPIGSIAVTNTLSRGRLRIPPAARRIVAVAYAADGVASSALDADLGPSTRTSQPRLWLVAVGISAYPGLARAAQLRFADDDARSLVETMTAQVGPGRTYRDAHVRLLVDEDATANAIGAALGELSTMSPDDVAIVAFSGHGMLVGGSTVMLLSATEIDDRGPTAVLAWDAVARGLAAARGRVLVLLDTCHAGAMSHDALAPNAELASRLVRSGRAGVVVFAASKGREASREDAAGGLFTQAVIAALRDAERDRRDLWVGDFVTSVQSRVVGLTAGRQTPWLVRADVFGDFRLINSPQHAGK